MEDLVDVGHIEVAAEAQVLGPPVVAPQEWVHVLQAAFAGGGIAQVAHQEFARHFFRHPREYLGDGILSLCLLAEHILRAGFASQAHRGNAGALLTAVVLFLHHQVELVQPISPRAILLLIIAQRLEQANHGHATFMLQLLHRYML